MSTYHDDRRFAYLARLGLFILTFALLSCGGSTTAPGGGATQLTLVVAPGSATVFVGGTTQYTVVATNSSGQVVTAPAVVWTSADPAVGTISTTGLATGVSPGQTIIVATAGSVVSTPATLVVDQLTLKVAPDTATVLVAGIAQYSVVATNSSGQVVPTPAIVWTSRDPAIGTISSAGIATGVSPGQTVVTATAGSVVSLPAVLNVRQTACDGIAGVREWGANLELFYQDDTTTKAGAKVYADHHFSVTTTLTAASPVSGKLEWTGSLLAGVSRHGSKYPVFLLETFDDQVSDPTEKIEFDGLTGPVPTPGVDGFRLEVDLSTCTFQFFAAPSARGILTKTEHAVNTLPGPDEGIQVFTEDIPFGLLQKGVAPLGAWRTLGLADSVENISSYPVGIAVPVNVDAYTPSGLFSQTAFFDPFNPAPKPHKADMYWTIVPKP